MKAATAQKLTHEDIVSTNETAEQRSADGRLEQTAHPNVQEHAQQFKSWLGRHGDFEQ